MIQSETVKIRSRHLAASFDQLNSQDQAYLEALTAQLAKIHETSPETSLSTGKTPISVVEQKEEQN